MKYVESNRLSDDEPHREPASPSTPRDVGEADSGKGDGAGEAGITRTIILRLPPFEEHRAKGKPFTTGFDDEFPTRGGAENWEDERGGNEAPGSTKRSHQVGRGRV